MTNKLTYLLLAAIALVCACGGTSSGAPDGGIGGNGDGGVVADKAPAFAAIKAKLATFDGSDRAQENRELLALVQGRSEFVESGLSATSKSVWARFADGRTLIIANNLGAAHLPRLAATAPPPPRPLPKETGVPGSSKVFLGYSAGNYFAESTQLEKLFPPQKYDVQSTVISAGNVNSDLVSVEGLKSFNDAAVLFLFAHGATAPLKPGGQEEYAVWTSTDFDKDLEATYKADLDDGSLVYFLAVQYEIDDQRQPLALGATRYAITAKFVQKYWTGRFAKRSIVYVNACSSSSEEALNFELAVLQAGAGLYLGWDAPVQGVDSIHSADWFFDRTLGANLVHAEAPPQRPFGPLEVLAEMETRARPAESASEPAPGGTLAFSLDPQDGDPAELTVMTLSLDDTILAPSLGLLGVDEAAGQLGVNGSLGDVQGKVLLDGAELEILSWDNVGAVCVLPPNAVGLITVALPNGQVSNAVPLTRWHGTATYTLEEAGSLSMSMTFDLSFRGDIHSPRQGPGDPEFDHQVSFSDSAVSAGTYSFSGRFDDNHADGSSSSVDWSGSGVLKHGQCASLGDACVTAVGGVSHGSWNLSVLAEVSRGKHVHTVTRNTQGTVITDQTSDQDAFGIDALFTGPNGFAGDLSGYSLNGGSRTIQTDSTLATGQKATLTLQWSAFTAQSPPDSQTKE